MPTKRRLLYLSPVMPAITGNGLAMRAGAVLELLAAHYRVWLLVVPLYGSPAVAVPTNFDDLCERAVVVPPIGRSRRTRLPGFLRRFVPGGQEFRRLELVDWIAEASQAYHDVDFDVVHVFRLAMLPFAQSYLGSAARRSPQRHLDLDDVESTTHRRLAALYRSNGDDALARFEETEAERSAQLEDHVLSHFDRIYVCSDSDRAALLTRARGELRTLPNTVQLPKPCAPRERTEPFTFLFVGTLGYYPNEDAVRFFCHEIIPLLKRRTTRAFRFVVVGTGATPAIRDLEQIPEVTVVGAVPDVTPWYHEADAVLVPVRAGGGTRIKILEAFGYRRPVVSTSIGIEGIDARDEEHLLVSDTPAAFSDQCLRLMDDLELARTLAANALALVRRAYSTAAVARTVAASL